MNKTISEFGYDPEFGGWFPKEVEFTATLSDVPQLDGTSHKQWLIKHNLEYYDLVFLGENALGINPKDITGEMIVKACLCASWDDCSVWWSTTFAEVVSGGDQAKEMFDEEDDNA